MNKTIIALGVACALALGSSAVQAKDLTGWYVKAGVGQNHFHTTSSGVDLGSDKDLGFQVLGGWRSQFIGVEAGRVDLGTQNWKVASPAGNSTLDLGIDGWTLGMNGHFNFTKMWYASVRGGMFMWKAHGNSSFTDPAGTKTSTSDSQQSTDWYAGIGTGVDINRNMSVGVNWNFYQLDKDSMQIDNRLWTVSFEYRF